MYTYRSECRGRERGTRFSIKRGGVCIILYYYNKEGSEVSSDVSAKSVRNESLVGTVVFSVYLRRVFAA